MPAVVESIFAWRPTFSIGGITKACKGKSLWCPDTGAVPHARFIVDTRIQCFVLGRVNIPHLILCEVWQERKSAISFFDCFCCWLCCRNAGLIFHHWLRHTVCLFGRCLINHQPKCLQKPPIPPRQQAQTGISQNNARCMSFLCGATKQALSSFTSVSWAFSGKILIFQVFHGISHKKVFRCGQGQQRGGGLGSLLDQETRHDLHRLQHLDLSPVPHQHVDCFDHPNRCTLEHVLCQLVALHLLGWFLTLGLSHAAWRDLPNQIQTNKPNQQFLLMRIRNAHGSVCSWTVLKGCNSGRCHKGVPELARGIDGSWQGLQNCFYQNCFCFWEWVPGLDDNSRLAAMHGCRESWWFVHSTVAVAKPAWLLQGGPHCDAL